MPLEHGAVGDDVGLDLRLLHVRKDLWNSIHTSATAARPRQASLRSPTTAAGTAVQQGVVGDDLGFHFIELSKALRPRQRDQCCASASPQAASTSCFHKSNPLINLIHSTLLVDRPDLCGILLPGEALGRSKPRNAPKGSESSTRLEYGAVDHRIQDALACWVLAGSTARPRGGFLLQVKEKRKEKKYSSQLSAFF